MKELIEMCKCLDSIEGVRTWIQGDSIYTNADVEIRTTINLDDCGQYKYIVISNHIFSDEMSYFDALFFAECEIRRNMGCLKQQ